MLWNDAAELLKVVAELLGTVGVARTVAAVVVLALAVFLVVLARNSARILAETYTVPATQGIARWIADRVLIISAALLRRRKVGAEVVEEALAMLDDYAVQGGLRGLALILQALILGWGVTEASSQRSKVDRLPVKVAGTGNTVTVGRDPRDVDLELWLRTLRMMKRSTRYRRLSDTEVRQVRVSDSRRLYINSDGRIIADAGSGHEPNK